MECKLLIYKLFMMLYNPLSLPDGRQPPSTSGGHTGYPHCRHIANTLVMMQI